MAGRQKGVDYSKRPWQEIRHKYETGQAGPKALSEIYKIPAVTIKSRASKGKWTRLRTKAQPGTTTITTPKPSQPSFATTVYNNGAALWVDERVDRLLNDIAAWIDSWDDEAGKGGVTLQAFCNSEHNTLGAKASQLTYLSSNQRYMEGMARLKPLVADRIATLSWSNKKNAGMGIFWLKQFGWTDRQEITTIDSGASLEAAISRVYDITPKK